MPDYAISDSLLGDVQFMRRALALDGRLLKRATPEVRLAAESILIATENCYDAIRYAMPSLRTDIDFCSKALRRNAWSFFCITEFVGIQPRLVAQVIGLRFYSSPMRWTAQLFQAAMRRWHQAAYDPVATE